MHLLCLGMPSSSYDKLLRCAKSNNIPTWTMPADAMGVTRIEVMRIASQSSEGNAF